jgi:hypothetical protein
MGHQFRALATRSLTQFLALPASVAISGIVVGVAAFGWLAAMAPPLMSFAVAVGAAMAWCAWLEEHPDAPLEANRSAQEIVTRETSLKL